jgi:hypothetical protein
MKWFQQVDKDIMVLFTETFLALSSTLILVFAVYFGNTIFILLASFMVEFTYLLLGVDIAAYYLFGVKEYLEKNPKKAKIIFWVAVLILFSPFLAMIITWIGVAAIYGGLIIMTVVEEIKKNFQKENNSKR